MKENDVFAFRLPEFSNVDGRQGMTLRDYFAGKALNGVIADPTVQVDPQTAAKACYEYADAMLTERGKE